jgi:hypothetical protein
MLKLIKFNHFSLTGLNFFCLSHSLQGSFMSKSDFIQPQDNKTGNWVGGKANGSIKLAGKQYVIKFKTKVLKKIEKNLFKDDQQAQIECRKVLYEYCKSSGNLLNEYRHCFDNSNDYLEVKVSKVLIQCDVQIKSIIEKYNWEYLKPQKTVFRREKNKKIKLEQDIFSNYSKDVKLAYLDGNNLNYRTKNLNLIQSDPKPPKKKK